MNKDGSIILLDTNTDNLSFLRDTLKLPGHKNELVYFSDANEAGVYIRENVSGAFLLLQNTEAPGIQLPDTRNMVYMHENFKTDALPYMFLVLTKDRTPLNTPHTFIHCYYKPDTVLDIAKLLVRVVDFWKGHVFPPRVTNQF